MVYAHLAYQNHNITPDEYMDKSVEGQAFMAASDLVAAQKMKGFGGW